jgi:glycosyl transferase family 87
MLGNEAFTGGIPMQDHSLSARTGVRATRAAEAIRGLCDRLLPKIEHNDDAEFLRALLLLGSALFTLTLVSYFWTTHWSSPFPRDKATLVVGRDFLNLWMYGRAAFEIDPARFYDIATYNGELATLLGPGYPGQNWPNPPTALLIMAPFGLLTYFPALIAWFAVGLLAFYLAGRRERCDARLLLIVLVSPAALLCVLSGQSSFVTTAALFAIFAWLDKRPLLAGILIGLLGVKPQLGVLFPFALLASGRWRVFASALVTTLSLLAASIAVGGVESWHDYIFKALPLQGAVLGDAAGTAMPFQPTVFMNVRGLLGNRIGEAVQITFAIAAIAAVTAAFRYRKRADPALLRALFFGCTASASPYMGAYDLLPLTFAAVILLAEGKLDAIGRRLAQLVFWTPALQLLFGNLQIPGPGFIAPAFVVYLLRQLFAPAANRAMPAKRQKAAV